MKLGYHVLRTNGDEVAQELLAILVCPKCKGELDFDRMNRPWFVRPADFDYGRSDGIPIMPDRRSCVILGIDISVSAFRFES